MLDKAACAALNAEMTGLKTLEVEALMQKGPEWALANLSAGDLSLIRKFIEDDEQIKFRCMPPASLVKLRGSPEDEETPVVAKAADGSTESADTGTASEAGSTPAQKPKQKPKPPVKKAAQKAQRTAAPKPAQTGGSGAASANQ
jgi:hypothetical protein